MKRKLSAIVITVIAVMMIVVTSCTLFEDGIDYDSDVSSQKITEISTNKSDKQNSIYEEELSDEETYIEYTFRTKKQFDSHYKKHGAEFGKITQEEYLRKANELINNDSDYILHKTEKEDGDKIYYDKINNEILFMSTDGFIRTYFKPSQGIAYYNRQ